MILTFQIPWIWNWPPCGNGEKTDDYSGHRIGISEFQIVNKPCKNTFPNLTQATVPRALYSVLQNFAGSILAYAFRKYQSLRQEQTLINAISLHAARDQKTSFFAYLPILNFNKFKVNTYY